MRALALICLTAATAHAQVTGPTVLVTDRAALADLEAHGFGLGERLRGGLGAVVARIENEMRVIARADPKAGVGVARFDHRLFDVRWLHAPWTRFELVGVTSRLDRKPFTGGCGDVRLVYRLAYDASRLPMTVSVELRAPDDCAAAARRWLAPAGLAGAALGAWLRSSDGPLDAEAGIDEVQVNLQSVRWPSAARPDLAAHAEYLLLAFKYSHGAAPLVAKPLENTPRVLTDPAERAELLDWARGHAGEIDAGTFLVPEKFLAARAVSVSPRGLARRANRPWLQMFGKGELPAPVLRRLDDATCVGCHQARSVAGFHLLGEDGPDSSAANALAVAGSPHLFAEVRRRAALVAALAAGQPGDFRRPLSERAPDDPGGVGAHCGLGDPAYAAWTCAAGLRCDPYDDPVDDRTVGICLPATPGTGDPCEIGPVVTSADPHRDRVGRTQARACRLAEVCNKNDVGFPGGMCTGTCAGLGDGAVCGKIAILRGFNDCLARKEPFGKCLAENARPASLRACDAAHPCRDDYLCARADRGGACIPPYFLFQMRVDGHP